MTNLFRRGDRAADEELRAEPAHDPTLLSPARPSGYGLFGSLKLDLNPCRHLERTGRGVLWGPSIHVRPGEAVSLVRALGTTPVQMVPLPHAG